MKQNSGDKNLENFQQIFWTLFLVLELWHNIHYIIHNGSDSHKKSKKINKNNNNNILPTWKNKYSQSTYNEADIDRNIDIFVNTSL